MMDNCGFLGGICNHTCTEVYAVEKDWLLLINQQIYVCKNFPVRAWTQDLNFLCLFWVTGLLEYISYICYTCLVIATALF